jgi:glycosyltransferase involved in cell wall biosynthesis
MKKILHLSKFNAPHYGGIERVVETITNGLSCRYKHIIISFKKSLQEDSKKRKNVENISERSLITILSQPINIYYFLHVKKYINNVDLVHVHAPNLVAFLAIIMFRKNTKFIVHWHSDIIKNSTITFFTKFLERYILNQSYKIIATSENYAKHSASLSKYQDKIKIIPIGVEKDKFNSEVDIENLSNKSIYKKNKNKKIALYVGRFVKYKSLINFIKSAVNLTDDAIIYLVGNGPEKKKMIETIQNCRLSNKVYILDGVNDQELNYLYKKARVFCLPSTTKAEAFGVVLVEALMNKIPLVVYNIPGSGVNWVNENNITGYSIENYQKDIFIKKVNEIILSDELHRKLSSGAEKRYGRYFTADSFIDSIEKIYEETISSNDL